MHDGEDDDEAGDYGEHDDDGGDILDKMNISPPPLRCLLPHQSSPPPPLFLLC